MSWEIKESRPMENVLQIIKDRLQFSVRYGICFVVLELARQNDISQRERDQVIKYMESHRPERTDADCFWWPPIEYGQQYLDVRIKFLEKLIWAK